VRGREENGNSNGGIRHSAFGIRVLAVRFRRGSPNAQCRMPNAALFISLPRPKVLASSKSVKSAIQNFVRAETPVS
jgi:hypothetical protein